MNSHKRNKVLRKDLYFCRQEIPLNIIEWRDPIEVGDRVDALFWPTGLWLRAQWYAQNNEKNWKTL